METSAHVHLLAKLSASYVEWEKDPSSVDNFVTLYNSLRDSVGHVRCDAAYAEGTEELQRARAFLPRIVQHVAAVPFHLASSMVGTIDTMVIHKNNWRVFLSEHKYSLAWLVLRSTFTDRPKTTMAGYEQLFADWTGTPVHITDETYRDTMAKVLFGESWVVLYWDELRNNPNRLHQELTLMPPPFTFEAATIPQDVSLPDNLAF